MEVYKNFMGAVPLNRQGWVLAQQIWSIGRSGLIQTNFVNEPFFHITCHHHGWAKA